jgi:hypothetical protein
MQQVFTLDLTAIFEHKCIGFIALHDKHTLMLIPNMGHKLRIAKPAISHRQRLGLTQTASAQGLQTLIEHELSPLEFAVTPSPGSFGIRPPDGEIDRDDQFAIAYDHHEQDAINAADHAFVLATVREHGDAGGVSTQI